MKGYRYIIDINPREGGGVEFRLNRPMKCTFAYFIEAFWVPIRHQIGKKLVLIGSEEDGFSLWYDQLAVPKDKMNLPQDEFIDYIRNDAKKVVETALRHVDRIVAYIYGDEAYGEEHLVPFIDTVSAIKSVEEATITMNGRLPMQEDYFIKHYWRPLVETYKSSYPGIQFGIHFSDAGTKITPSLAFRERDAKAKKHNVSIAESPDAILQMVACDLADAILQAAADYAEACE